MFKQKVKFSLIEDYINLLKIDKALLNCDNYKCLKHYEVNEHLKDSYESLFLKYGLLDISFLVLKKEITSANVNIFLKLDDIEMLQNNIVKGLMEKFKKLKLNDVEVKYLTKKINVKNC